MKYILNTVFSIMLLSGISFAGDKTPITDPGDRISYSLGHQIGTDLQQQGVEVNLTAVRKGIDDALAGSAPQLSPEEMNSLLLSLKKNIVETEQLNRRQKQRTIKEAYRGEGREFLAQNSQEQGVVTLPSGLQYMIETEGSGRTPGPHDTVKVDYRGTLLDGNEFYSTYRRGGPAVFKVDGVIAGMKEALQLMHEGAKWRIFVPADLAYGERGPLADRTVIFDIELLAVEPGK